MRRFSYSVRTLLWTIALAVFATQASGAHLHLCFDGQEPPTTVHFADASVHPDHGDNEQHADKDLNPLVGLFKKSGTSDADLALPACVVGSVLLLPPPRSTPPAAYRLPIVAGRPLHLRPPLRGPPA